MATLTLTHTLSLTYTCSYMHTIQTHGESERERSVIAVVFVTVFVTVI